MKFEINKFLMKAFKRIISFILVLYVAVCFVGCTFQKKMIFIPSKKVIRSPKTVRIDYRDIFVGEDDVHCWWIPAKQSDAKTVLFCHGNAGNISNRLDTVSFYYHEMNCNLMIFDYSGYGKSGGEVGEKNSYKNVRDVYDYMINELKVKPEDLIVHGRSLGGAVAADLAVDNKCGGLILESTFSSIDDMVSSVLPLLPIGWAITIEYDTIGKIDRIKVPMLIIHSKGDEIIPFYMGENLYKSASKMKHWLEIEGDHNYGWIESQKVYSIGMKEFIFAL